MSRGTPTVAVLLELIELVNKLLSEKDLPKLIKEAYGLSEAEEVKVKEAQAVLNAKDQLLAEVSKREAKYADIERRIAEAKEAEESNIKTSAELAKKNKQLDDLIDLNQKSIDDLKIKEELLINEEKRLSELALSLEKKYSEISQYEMRVKQAAEAASRAVGVLG